MCGGSSPSRQISQPFPKVGLTCRWPHWRNSRLSAIKLPCGLEIVVRPRLLGWTPHDFRRTAARNLIRAGVPQHVAMQLCGWKTDAMFRRYAIVDLRDLTSAVEMLAKGTTGAQSKVKAVRAVG